jgi:glycosyltransferase involved in cell wall biosynthesis
MTAATEASANSCSPSGNLVRVVQTVHGKFHHFDLARQLHRRGMLEAIFTGYPRWKLGQEKLPREKVRTFPWIRTFLMAKWRLGLEHAWLDRELNWWAALSLDAYVASHLPDCDVFVAISGAGLKTGILVKNRGGRYICDRGSAHIRFVQRILAEEFKRWGQDFPEIDPRAVAREEREYLLADLITVPSSFAAKSFLDWGIPVERVQAIPYGVELERFCKVAEPPRDSFEVLFVGSVSFQKGVPYLLEAFKGIKRSNKRLRVVGAVQGEMARFLRGKNTEKVEFLGPIGQSRLVSIMSTSHVLVLPSIQDGFGMVLSQAMACGCPVICSQNTAGEDLVVHGRDGYVIPIRSSEKIRDRLEQLSQDPQLQHRMSEAAVRRVQLLGGWDDYGAAFAQACEAMVSKASRN